MKKNKIEIFYRPADIPNTRLVYVTYIVNHNKTLHPEGELIAYKERYDLSIVGAYS